MKALYGFVAWIATHICILLFLVWAYIPEGVLADLGITWYPDKYWAVALPCYSLVSLLAVLFVHWSRTMMYLPPLESLSSIVDEFSNFPTESDLGCALLPPVPSTQKVTI